MEAYNRDELAKIKSQKRVTELVDRYFGGNKKDFADAVGIHKASVTQYTNGSNAPGNVNSAKIAKYFNLNPLWVMGFDVEKEADSAPNAVLVVPHVIMEVLESNSRDSLIAYAEFLRQKDGDPQ